VSRSRNWFDEPDPKHVSDTERIAALEAIVQQLATFIGVDLDVVRVVNGWEWRAGYVSWEGGEVRRELDELEQYLDRGEPMPPAENVRGKTLRRLLMLERSCQPVTG